MVGRGPRRVAGCFVAAAVLVAAVGCKATPVLRLTYRIDADASYEAGKDASAIVEECRSVVVRRLDGFLVRRSFAVSTKGRDLIVELAALDLEVLSVVEDLIAKPGRLALKRVDEAGTRAIFVSLSHDPRLEDEGIQVFQESVPDGLDDGDHKKSTPSYYARVRCGSGRHEGESVEQCLARFKAWTWTLAVPSDREIGIEAVYNEVPGSNPVELRQVAWRTLWMLRQTEMTESAVVDVSAGKDSEGEGYSLHLSLSPPDAAHFETLTGANVNRRIAIVLDGKVASAPVVRERVVGGRVTVTTGGGSEQAQRREATLFQQVLRAGALPAPIDLVSEQPLRRGAP